MRAGWLSQRVGRPAACWQERLQRKWRQTLGQTLGQRLVLSLGKRQLLHSIWSVAAMVPLPLPRSPPPLNVQLQRQPLLSLTQHQMMVMLLLWQPQPLPCRLALLPVLRQATTRQQLLVLQTW